MIAVDTNILADAQDILEAIATKTVAGPLAVKLHPPLADALNH